MTDILTINEEVIPKFPKHVKFKYNKPRDEWVLLAPERLVKLDDISVEILQLVNGMNEVRKISNDLAKKFNAPLDVIQKDVINLLQTLADKGFIAS
tara:strand:- start:521 stop:808 length:288 start_codon:yes stop_codon:yes gene_type:complete